MTRLAVLALLLLPLQAQASPAVTLPPGSQVGVADVPAPARARCVGLRPGSEIGTADPGCRRAARARPVR